MPVPISAGERWFVEMVLNRWHRPDRRSDSLTAPETYLWCSTCCCFWCDCPYVVLARDLGLIS